MPKPLLAATTTADGEYLSAANPCKTPVPGGPPMVLPYPSKGLAAQMVKTSRKVMIGLRDTVTEASKTPMSTGDAAGSLGGVSSGTTMGPVQPSVGSGVVAAEGKKVAYATAASKHNKNNAVGLQTKPSQNDVLIAG